MKACVQCKLDGISLRATYQNGQLLELVTRGDGQVGDDITAHAPHLYNLPSTIPEPGTVHVRGEAIIYEADFEAHYKQRGFKNARNTASGLLKGRSGPADLKHVHFVAYEYYGDQRASLRYESTMVGHLQRLGFEIPQISILASCVDEATKIYQAYDQAGGRETLPYKTDGLVVKVDDIRLHGSCPTVNNRPGHATAIKPSTKAAVTKVKSLEWSMGLSGRFSPVAQLEPVELDGVELKNVSMHNLAFLRTWVEKGFGVGSTVLVERSGDVIPYLREVVAPATPVA